MDPLAELYALAAMNAQALLNHMALADMLSLFWSTFVVFCLVLELCGVATVVLQCQGGREKDCRGTQLEARARLCRSRVTNNSGDRGAMEIADCMRSKSSSR
jgi:hypothetical protein